MATRCAEAGDVRWRAVQELVACAVAAGQQSWAAAAAAAAAVMGSSSRSSSEAAARMLKKILAIPCAGSSRPLGGSGSAASIKLFLDGGNEGGNEEQHPHSRQRRVPLALVQRGALGLGVRVRPRSHRDTMLKRGGWSSHSSPGPMSVRYSTVLLMETGAPLRTATRPVGPGTPLRSSSS
jgi:hypothetical protein